MGVTCVCLFIQFVALMLDFIGGTVHIGLFNVSFYNIKTFLMAIYFTDNYLGCFISLPSPDAEYSGIR